MRISILLAAGLVSLSGGALAADPDANGGEPTPAPQAGEASDPFIREDAEAAVRDLAVALEETYLFPETGARYAELLRSNLAAGRYSEFPDAGSFARRVTEDLRALHRDGHLRLEVIRPDAGGNRQMSGPPSTNDVARAGWLADGVAYIDFTGFPGNEATLARVRDFLSTHRDARTLIIDARRNGGGGLAEMNLIFAQIFAQPTTLVTMDIRTAVEEKFGAPFDAREPTLRRVKGPVAINRREHYVVPAADQGGLRDARVYLLTSRGTFSAAEHLSLSLKRTHRATLVGEPTGGGAHFGGMAPMGKGYAAFIPVGRTFDPDTGESWEGTGVQPDVSVPADQALDEALRLAGVRASGSEVLASLK